MLHLPGRASRSVSVWGPDTPLRSYSNITYGDFQVLCSYSSALLDKHHKARRGIGLAEKELSYKDIEVYTFSYYRFSVSYCPAAHGLLTIRDGLQDTKHSS